MKVTPESKLKQYKKMLSFKEENPERNFIAIRRLRKEVEYYEKQVEANQALKREKRRLEYEESKSFLKQKAVKPQKEKAEDEATHQVVTVETDIDPIVMYKGSKRNCEAYVRLSGLITVEVEEIS